MTLAIAPKSLSSWWAGSHHRALGSTTSDPVRLAIVLGAVKSAVRVVDRTHPALTVDWAEHDPEAVVKSMSYTDMTNGHIRINPSAVLDHGIDHGVALDVSIGFGLHEASHSQESRDRYKYLVKMEQPGISLREVPAFEPMRVAAYLWNLVEDVRIEKATSKNWPGFAPYFGVVLRYMWTEMRRHHELPVEYSSKIEDRLKVVYLACRYPAKFSPTDPALVAEVAWWQAWQHDYLTDAVDTPTTIQRGLDHLAEDAATKQELDEQSAQEKKEREAGERLKNQIDRLIREGAGAFGVCVTEQGEVVPLDAETAEEVRQLVREGLIETHTFVPGNGVSLAPIRVRRPEETPESKRAYVGRPDATTEALRAALVFRASAPQHDEKLLKAGRIDDEELYRWAAGDMRVFSERVIESKPDVFVGLLVDISGSMYGSKLTTAQRLAQLLTWATHDQEGVETAVWAHTADIDGDVAEVYRIWAKGDPLSRLGLLGSLENGDNRDSQAIELVAAEMAQVEQPEKVLIVLSDGLPSANSYNGKPYGGRPAQEHVRAVTKWAASRGVKVIQIAVDPHGLRPEEQTRMYGNEGTGWIGFRDYASLPRQLAALLSRYV